MYSKKCYEVTNCSQLESRRSAVLANLSHDDSAVTSPARAARRTQRGRKFRHLMTNLGGAEAGRPAANPNVAGSNPDG